MIVITQIPEGDVVLPFKARGHQPSAFCCGSFKHSASKWSDPEKEAYPILYAVRRFDFLLCTSKKPLIFTDHRNLVFLYSSDKVNDSFIVIL